MCEGDDLKAGWQCTEPKWLKQKKHMPRKGAKLRHLVAGTKSRPAVFDPALVGAQFGWGVEKTRELLEMHCVLTAHSKFKGAVPDIYKDSIPIPQFKDVCGRVFPARGENGHENITDYWIEWPFVIGASGGETTKYMWVEWQCYGGDKGLNEVHGRPVTKKKLQDEGAEL